MESLKYLSGDDSFFKEFLAIFLLFGIVPNCWKDIVSENKYFISCPLLTICKPYNCSHCFDQLHWLRDDNITEAWDVTEM